MIVLPTYYELLNHQLAHYSQRLAEERAKGNTAAVAFLRSELHNLKNPKPQN